MCLSTCFSNFRCCYLKALNISGADCDSRALSGKFQGNPSADPTASAGHKYRLTA